MKIYARQIDPAFQESPLFADGFWPEGVITDGNHNYHSRTTDEYDLAKRYFDEMKNDWDKANYYYRWNSETSRYDVHKQRPNTTIGELLDFYGFKRTDGKPWSNAQKHKWRLLMEDADLDEDDAQCAAMELLTGHKWDCSIIRGCCQSDWQGVFYDTTLYDRKGLAWFEAEYFNTGTEWLIHDEKEEPDCPENINGYAIYCYEWREDDIRAEIAREAGCEPKDVVMYEFNGYSCFPKYREVV